MAEKRVFIKAISPINKTLLVEDEQGIDVWTKISDKVLDYLAGKDIKDREAMVTYDKDEKKIVMVKFIDKEVNDKEERIEIVKDKEDYWQQRLVNDEKKNREVRRLALLNTATKILEISQYNADYQTVMEKVLELAKKLEGYITG